MRNKSFSYVEYRMSIITVTRLLELLCGIKNMRETTNKFNTEETIENIGNLLEVEIEEIPHYYIINNVFEKLEIDELRRIQKYITKVKKKNIPLIISGDALYTCEAAISVCRENKWEYILKLKEDKITDFLWITSFKIIENNKEELVYYGRQRWKIENESFNIQKNGTFDIEHIYSINYNEMKAHYFFIQFAHTIRQLLEKGLKYVKELKMSIKK